MASPNGNNQLAQTDSPHLVTMTAGGNNAGFFKIATSCIYQPDPTHNYGPVYPDPAGDCAQAIAESSSIINGRLGNDLKNTIDDILNAPNVRNTRDFYLYVTGYAHFFNIDEEWCNSESFAANPVQRNKPKLAQELRTTINGLVQSLNTVNESTIRNRFPAKNVRYVSVTE